jgi:hypothetical protein
MIPTSGSPKRQPGSPFDRNLRLLLLAGVTIALVAWGYPSIRSEHHRLARVKAGSTFDSECTAKLSGDPRFARVSVSVDTGGRTTVEGQVDSPQSYADLKAIVLSCKCTIGVSLNVYYPHKPPGVDETFVFSDNEFITPAE